MSRCRAAHGAAAAVVVALAVGATVGAARASCAPDGTPDASDITYVHVRQYPFPVPREPAFDVAVLRRTVLRPNGDALHGTSARLIALRTEPVPRGNYVLAGDAAALLRDLAATLERADYTTIRFSPATRMLLEGPNDTVTVQRCGVTTIISTNPDPLVAQTYSDANGKRFLDLVDAIDAIVSAQNWVPEPPPIPARPVPLPSATPR